MTDSEAQAALDALVDERKAEIAAEVDRMVDAGILRAESRDSWVERCIADKSVLADLRKIAAQPGTRPPPRRLVSV
jgi:hypothetical protein